jgi:hypothetical protein
MEAGWQDVREWSRLSAWHRASESANGRPAKPARRAEPGANEEVQAQAGAATSYVRGLLIRGFGVQGHGGAPALKLCFCISITLAARLWLQLACIRPERLTAQASCLALQWVRSGRFPHSPAGPHAPAHRPWIEITGCSGPCVTSPTALPCPRPPGHTARGPGHAGASCLAT